MKKPLAAFLAAAAFARGGTPQTADLEFPAAHDVWHYFNAFNAATRELAPPFLLPQSFSGGDRRDATVALVFDIEAPTGFPANFRVTQARLRVWDIRFAQWTTGGTNEYGGPRRIELFAAGFGPAYSEATWDGTQPFIGGNNDSSFPRDPFPRDLATDANVQNEVLSYAPWAIGAPVGYAPGAMTQAFPIDFTLDVADPTIQQELRDDLASGFSSWIVSSTFVADFMGLPGTIPNVVMAEGIGSHPPATAPTLFLTIEEVTAASATSWFYYE
ncbi:MAG: hypothetical protein SF028_11290 [Candidatus Sumerlaeia bacterium]|nr:hypothetical protein [Candidatus Sumerlaeia bacterium]